MNIHGKITFEKGAPSFRNADLHLCLEDVSEADAASSPIVQTTLHGVSWSGKLAETREFVLKVAQVLAPNRQYQVRAHLDLQRTGQVAVRDFVSAKSYPIDPSARVQRLSLQLRWLKP